MVDGQQRFTTTINFIKGEYEVKNKKSVSTIKNIIEDFYNKYTNTFDEEDLKNYRKVVINKSSKINFNDLPKIMQDQFKSYNLNVTELYNFDKDEMIVYFKFVQNQEKLKAGEIINSVSFTNQNLNQLFEKIIDKQGFLDLIGIRNKRFEFDKVLINVIGVLERKIRLNVGEGEIIDFASSESNFEKINKNEYVSKIVRNINYITNIGDNLIKKEHVSSFSIGSMKEILLFFSFFDLDKEDIEIVKLFKVINKIRNDNSDFIIEKVKFIESQTHGFDVLKKVANNILLLMKEGYLNE